ncbi:MAG: Uma2 family endonuclease [Planctomycetes bacterium]|nr:Uma2 family endonuclease [Planctomycetota bacterium]
MTEKAASVGQPHPPAVPARLPPSPSAGSEQRFVLRAVDWRSYGEILRILGDRHVFVTYDRGSLELMSPSPEHESYKSILRCLLDVLVLELDIDVRRGASTTFRREDVERGLEPDECYWIGNEQWVRGRPSLDLTRDPPPDLAVEIDVTSSSLDRQGIYAALRVPEIWRFDGQALRVYILQPDGSYLRSEMSRSFPSLPLAEFEGFLRLPAGMRENEWIRRFQAWVRQNLKRG